MKTIEKCESCKRMYEMIDKRYPRIIINTIRRADIYMDIVNYKNIKELGSRMANSSKDDVHAIHIYKNDRDIFSIDLDNLERTK